MVPASSAGRISAGIGLALLNEGILLTPMCSLVEVLEWFRAGVRKNVEVQVLSPALTSVQRKPHPGRTQLSCERASLVFEVLLVFEAVSRGGVRFQSLGWDRPTARLADAVRSLLEHPHRPIDIF